MLTLLQVINQSNPSRHFSIDNKVLVLTFNIFRLLKPRFYESVHEKIEEYNQNTC